MRTRLDQLLQILVMAALLGGIRMGGATEYFVAPSGGDSAAGDAPAAAWRTIQRGAAALQPGDILTIAPGIYAEAVVVEARGSADRPIVIRARRPGFTVIKASRRLVGFEPVPGTRFVSAARSAEKFYNVLETDTHRMLMRAPGAVDLDQFRAAYFYDDAAQMLYVHTSDGLPAAAHSIEATVRPGFGLALKGARHVRLEGLAFQGHYIDEKHSEGFGLKLEGAEHCEVRDCTFMNNAGGVIVRGKSADCIVSGCLFVGNIDPLYGEMGQLFVRDRSVRCSAIDNIVLNADTHGIRFYSSPSNCVAIGNIVKGARIGLYFKASYGERRAFSNVVVGCTKFNFSTGRVAAPFEEGFNTCESPSYWETNVVPRPSPMNLVFGEGDPNPGFCDPDRLDYRLQSDSPFRGKAQGGAGRGAYQYEGNVFFVGPSGDDGNEGTCVARPWRTLRHACSRAAPGATVYLLPGEHPGPLQPAQSGTQEKPIIFRARGAGVTATVTAPPGSAAACDLAGRSFVTVEGIRFGGGRNAVRIGGGEGITIGRCIADGAADAAISIENAVNTQVKFTLARHAAGAAVKLAGDNADVAFASCALVGGGREAVLDCGETTPRDLFLEYNSYFAQEGGALIRMAGKSYAALADWRAAAGLDAYSLAGDPKIADLKTGDIAPDSPLVGAGQFGEHCGPGAIEQAAREETIADVELRQVTPDSASFTWWTPRTSSALWRSTSGWTDPPPPLTRIRYGTNPACGQAVVSAGDLYHRVTLFDLEPDTTYHYRIELVGKPVASAPAQFRTPSRAAWRPQRRTIYVSTAGSDANDGLTRAAPVQTLARAGEEARAGDVILVAPGIYRGTFAPAASGTAEAPITLKSEQLSGAVVDGSYFFRPSAIAVLHQEHIVIDGFVFQGFAAKLLGRRAGYDYAQVYVFGSRDVRVQNCCLFGYGTYGLAAILKQSRDLEWRNNVFVCFVNAISTADADGLQLIGNTFYAPQIRNLYIAGRRAFLRNNLFFGQNEQKYRMEDISVPAEADMDYNAYVFNANDTQRYIGGPGRSYPAR